MPAAKKRSNKKQAAPTSKAAGRRRVVKPGTPVAEPAPAEIDLEAELTVESLMAQARVQEAEREARAVVEARKSRALRGPVATRPLAALHWGYPYHFDEALPSGERAALTAWFARFTTVMAERGSGYCVVGPDTPPEARRAAWDAGVEVVEVEQLRALMPTDDEAERRARLAEVLARPSAKAWSELVMLLATWDEATLAEAIAEAERGLAAWPDELRAGLSPELARPELRRLARTFCGDLARADDVSHVTVVVTQDMDGLAAGQVRFEHVRSLEVSGRSGLPEVLAGCTGFRGLERVVLHQPAYSQGTGQIDLAALLRAPHVAGLTGLSLYGYSLRDEDVEALAECTQPLEHLKIQYANLQPRAARALARLAERTRLRSLDLKYNDLGPKGAKVLFERAESWSRLRVLDISANEIGDAGVAAIAAARMPALRWLSVSSNDPKNQVSAAGARALAEADGFGELDTLHLFGHPIGAEGVAALLHARGLRSLRQLNAYAAGVSLAELASRCGPDPGPIAVLNLGSPRSSAKRGLDLGKATFLRTIRSLCLDGLDGAEYAAVLGCPHLESLEVLVLGGGYANNDEAFTALTTVTPPPRLRYVNLSGWKLTPTQAATLAASPLGRQLWGVELMASYTPPDAWYALYRGGLPMVGSVTYDAHAPNEFASATPFRDDA